MLRLSAVIRLSTCIAFALAPVVASPLAAGPDKKPRAVAKAPAAIKDCTRLNGRYGYYDNPWCTPAEQQAWDRASARRTR